MRNDLTVAAFGQRLSTLKPKLVSFDVFDTLLTRTYARPTDLFLDCGAQLREKTIFAGTNEDFRHYRVTAERALQHGGRASDATLAQIYTQLAQILGWSDNQTQLAQQIEIELEKKALIGVPLSRGYLDLCRAQKIPIIFTSDMYLPSGVIQEILLRYGLAQGEEKIFVSCEAGGSKWSGELFDTILRTYQLSGPELLHVGDNAHSDHHQPASKGIATVRIFGTNLTLLEENFLPFSVQTGGLASRLAASSRIARTQLAAQGSVDGLHDLGAAVLGPILTCFSAWLFAQARTYGIKRLYFISRDGQIMREIALRLQQRSPVAEGIECRYLHGSRLSWHHASFTALTPRHLRWMLDPQPKINLQILAERLCVKAADLAPLFAQATQSELGSKSAWNEQDLHHVRQLLQSHEATLLKLVGSVERNTLARRYFQQEGLNDDTVPWALVELGWVGRMLTSFSHAYGGERSIKAFYLGLTGFDPDRPARLLLNSFLIKPDGIISRMGQGLRVAELMEILTAADHATVAGYREVGERIEPILKTGGQSLWDPQDLKIIREAAYAFVGALPDEVVANIFRAVEDPSQSELLAQCLLGTLTDFARTPPPEVARAFTRCRFTEDVADTAPRSFIDELNFKRAWNFNYSNRDALLWPQGTLAISKGVWQALALHGPMAAISFSLRKLLGLRV